MLMIYDSFRYGAGTDIIKQVSLVVIVYTILLYTERVITKYIGTLSSENGC